MKLKDIKPNPNNPRVLRDDKFQKLKQSIKEFPKMLSLRPMVIDENNVVLGGNMRLRVLQELGFNDIDEAWVKRSSDLTEEEKKRFIIADNVSFGEWDWDTLANDWDVVDLEAWGLEIPFYDEEVKQEESKEEEELNVIELKFYDKDYKIVKEKLNSISMSPEIAVLKLLGVE
jgi:ParB-like chromosome segregation protein Spo0J